VSISELLELDAPAAPTGTERERDRTRRQVLDAIRGLHGTHGGLSRVHHTHAALYAQARRAFGTWRAAVAAAGIDYHHERSTSLKRGLSMRDQRRAVWHALSRFLIDHPGADQGLLDSIRPELARRVHRCWGGLGAARTWAAERGSRATA
jgi:hypothetical protein